MVQLVVQLVRPTGSDNFLSFTQLTKTGVIFSFTRCGISCILQVVTRSRIV